MMRELISRPGDDGTMGQWEGAAIGAGVGLLSSIIDWIAAPSEEEIEERRQRDYERQVAAAREQARLAVEIEEERRRTQREAATIEAGEGRALRATITDITQLALVVGAFGVSAYGLYLLLRK